MKKGVLIWFVEEPATVSNGGRICRRKDTDRENRIERGGSDALVEAGESCEVGRVLVLDILRPSGSRVVVFGVELDGAFLTCVEELSRSARMRLQNSQ
jgi:hypothetical protein